MTSHKTQATQLLNNLDHLRPTPETEAAAATAHALLEIAEQLRIQNLITITTNQEEEEEENSIGYVAKQGALNTLTRIKIHEHYTFDGIDETQIRELHPHIATTLGITESNRP